MFGFFNLRILCFSFAFSLLLVLLFGSCHTVVIIY